MKGYLTHLILRQQGEAPAIRPRLPSRFERAAEIEQSAAPQFFAAGRPAAQVSAAFAAKDDHAPSEPDSSLGATSGTLTAPELRGPVGTESDARVAQLPQARMLAPKSGVVQDGAPHDPEMAGFTEHAHATSQAAAAARETSQPQARVAEPSVTRLSAAKVRAAQAQRPPQQVLPAALQADAPPRRNQATAAVERPSIRVSIGRIDVRADLSKAPPPKPASGARAPQPQPLADYLKGRGAA
jgi:hypothetical protein